MVASTDWVLWGLAIGTAFFMLFVLPTVARAWQEQAIDIRAYVAPKCEPLVGVPTFNRLTAKFCRTHECWVGTHGVLAPQNFEEGARVCLVEGGGETVRVYTKNPEREAQLRK